MWTDKHTSRVDRQTYITCGQTDITRGQTNIHHAWTDRHTSRVDRQTYITCGTDKHTSRVDRQTYNKIQFSFSMQDRRCVRDRQTDNSLLVYIQVPQGWPHKAVSSILRVPLNHTQATYIQHAWTDKHTSCVDRQTYNK